MCDPTKIALVILVLFLIWKYILDPNFQKPNAYNYLLSQELSNYSRLTDRFTPRYEGFNPSYEKELALFKSMTFNQQQAYLNLSKEQKYATYGDKLM